MPSLQARSVFTAWAVPDSIGDLIGKHRAEYNLEALKAVILVRQARCVTGSWVRWSLFTLVLLV